MSVDRALWVGLVAAFGITTASAAPPDKISHGASANAVAVRNPSPGQAKRTATITVRAVGATMEFRTLGRLPTAFTVADGASQTFTNLQPGTYVVAQAPPIGVSTQVGPDQFVIEGGTLVQCSMPGSTHQFDLQRGDVQTCTYTALVG